MSANPDSVKLSEKDRYRMNELHKQVSSTLLEIAGIAAETLGKRASGSGIATAVLSTEDKPRTVKDGTVLDIRIKPSLPDDIYILVIDDAGHCFVYEDPPGICRPCGT